VTTLNNLVVFSGNASNLLAQKICGHLGIELGKSLVSCFADQETRVEICENIRGKDVYLIQSTSCPANQNIMEALIMVDACRRASASGITLVAPYFGYARQDRKIASRTSISAKLVAELFEAAGITRMVSLELHNSAIQGFFNVPFDHLFAKLLFYNHFKNKNFKDLVVISPDAGGVERSRALAKQFSVGLAIVDKRRDRPNESLVMNIIGDVDGKECLIIDDIVDTGGSLVRAAEALNNAGAREVYAAISHPVLSQDAARLVANSCIKELIVTDTITLSKQAQAVDKIVQISATELIAESIRRIHKKESISSLFA
jgi:ribose-phosphate pyrophosphokinase